jgi:hypothetical protein
MRLSRPLVLVSAAVGLDILAGTAHAITPRKAPTSLARKAFSLPELYISSATAPLAEVIDRLPNQAAWRDHLRAAGARGGGGVHAYIDQRSGAASALVQAFPLIPGPGVGNQVTLESLSQMLGRPVEVVDSTVVGDAAVIYVNSVAHLLGIESVGNPQAVSVTSELWQVTLLATFSGVPGLARVRVTVSHGNVILAGASNWHAAPAAGLAPAISAETALAAGFAYAEGRAAGDKVVQEPRLEVVPTAPPQHQKGDRFTGPIGQGYGARLVWKFVFQRPSEIGTWEVMVDAHSGEVISLQDVNHYAKRQFTGGVYPLTNTDVCPTPQTCGAMQPKAPMPFADTGLPAPFNFTNSAGVCEYTSGTAVTKLNGRFVRIQHAGTTTEFQAQSSQGAISLGGINGQHDLTTPNGSEGANNPSVRTAYYELNKMFEIGRGYLPGNDWLQAVGGSVGTKPLDARVNVRSLGGDPFACNAYYVGSYLQEVGFAHSGVSEFDGSVCRNTGEDTATLDHEWGHALDDNDAFGEMSNSSEGYADIAAIYRTQSSCIGHGSFISNPDGCGPTADGTGVNVNESQNNVNPGGPYCTTNCSGVRDADWVKHNPSFPANAVDFVCRSCNTSTFYPGPCGKQTHCASTPVRQAAWDLAARELTAAPFNYNNETAFIIANKLFYQGSGSVGVWFACACANGGLSHGCDAETGYMQWLTADDDNGSLNDGTPHMTAIHAAFTRHGIGCQTLPALNSGCAAGPAEAPSLTVTPGHFQARLTWTGVPGATRYWVFRSEGHAGCDYGKALIGEVSGQSFTDTEVAAGRTYSYNVVAAGASPSCFGRASICRQVTPTAGTFTVSCSPNTLTIYGVGSASTTCSVKSVGGYASAVRLGCAGLPSGAACTASPAEVVPPPNGTANVTVNVFSSFNGLPPGTYGFSVRGTPSANPGGTHAAAMTLKVPGQGDDLTAIFDPGQQAPRCPGVVGRSCDTGTLVTGRGLAGSEPNQPNTVNASCADGEGGARDGSNDRVRVATLDGTPFAPGKTVRVTATVRARTDFAQDAADFFYAADGSNPAWIHLGTSVPPAAGPQTLTATYDLPRGTVQAVRVQLRAGGDTTACSPGSLDDRDDLIFAVLPQ